MRSESLRAVHGTRPRVRWATRTGSIGSLIGGRSTQKEQSEPTVSASGEVHREPLQIGERAVVEGTFVRSPQNHAGRPAGLERFLPARRTQAPTVAGPQAGKAELWHRRRKIIAAGFGKLEELSSHDGADGMTADVFLTRIAAAVSEEPRHGLRRAIFESVA